MQETVERSSIDIESNLYLLEDHFFSPLDDRNFLASIEEPRALEQLKADVVDQQRNTYFRALTPRQQEIYDRMSNQCMFALENDYPWGVPLGAPENAKAVCYCQNIACARFSKCRPDVDVVAVKEATVVPAPETEVPEAAPAAKEPEPLEAPAEKEPEPVETPAAKEPELAEAPAAKEPEPTEAPETKKTETKAAPAKEPKKEAATPKAGTMHEWLATLPRETQEDFLACGAHERVFVNAGPGTGKTWALIQRIVQLLQDDTIAPENVVVLCYSRAAKAVIEGRLMACSRAGTIDQRWRLMDIFTLDSFSARILAFLRRHGIALPKRPSNTNGYDWTIQQMLCQTKAHSEIFAEAQYFIVDEIQDLVRERAELVLAILDALPESCGVSLLGDFCQAIYDYDAKTGMDAEVFYEELFRRSDAFCCMEFSENHRMTEERLAMLQPLREALLRGDAAAVRTVAADLSEHIPAVDVDFENEDTFGDVFEQADDLAILTRMNGQTLRISSSLLSADVIHTRLLPEENSALAPWIADVFCHFDGATIEREEFVEAWHAHGPADVDDETIDACWRALMPSCGGSQSRYEVEDLLKNILEAGVSEPLFFAESWLPSQPVTVSNVHRAKGREYEDVWIENGLLTFDNNMDDKMVLQEGKNLYVALSRAKYGIHRIPLPYRTVTPMYGREILWNFRKDEKTSRNKRSRRRSVLYQYTFDAKKDICEENFADAEIQEIFDDPEMMFCGLSLYIRSMKEKSDQPPRYELWDSDGDFCFGRISKTFMRDFQKLYCLPFKWPRIPLIMRNQTPKFLEGDYPTSFSGLTCSSKTTCLGELSGDHPSIRHYGSLSIWYGLTAYGLMSYDYDDCY